MPAVSGGHFISGQKNLQWYADFSVALRRKHKYILKEKILYIGKISNLYRSTKRILWYPKVFDINLNKNRAESRNSNIAEYIRIWQLPDAHVLEFPGLQRLRKMACTDVPGPFNACEISVWIARSGLCSAILWGRMMPVRPSAANLPERIRECIQDTQQREQIL